MHSLRALAAILAVISPAPSSCEEVVIGADGLQQQLQQKQQTKVKVNFVNLSPYPASLYWDDGRYGVLISASVAKQGGILSVDSFLGHAFFWTWEGSRETLGEDHTIVAGQTRYELPADAVRSEQAAGGGGEAGEAEGEECSDRYPRQCPRDAQRGECLKNPGWMTVNCARSCEYCHLLDPAKRCDRVRLNMTEAPFLAPGDLDALFERAVRDFPQLGPRVLSSPAASDGEQPWVVLFDNFVEEEEIDALIEAAGGAGFRRSTDTGPANKRGEVKKIVSTSRTSQNSWCTHACEQLPLVRSVTDRIEAVTGVPNANYEQFQVLRYEEGQYYKPHHDAGAASFKLACGPRILTFFLYLSDVEEGGGTRFPKIPRPDGEPGGLVVNPRRGQAVVWPSVLSEQPGRVDSRTTHEAMPVIKGLKFAANHWIHDYNFKVANIWGCTGAFD